MKINEPVAVSSFSWFSEGIFSIRSKQIGFNKTRLNVSCHMLETNDVQHNPETDTLILIQIDQIILNMKTELVCKILDILVMRRSQELGKVEQR